MKKTILIVCVAVFLTGCARLPDITSALEKTQQIAECQAIAVDFMGALEKLDKDKVPIEVLGVLQDCDERWRKNKCDELITDFMDIVSRI